MRKKTTKVQVTASEEYRLPAGKYTITTSPVEGDSGICLTDGKNFFIPVIVWMRYHTAEEAKAESPLIGGEGWTEDDVSEQILEDNGHAVITCDHSIVMV